MHGNEVRIGMGMSINIMVQRLYITPVINNCIMKDI